MKYYYLHKSGVITLDAEITTQSGLKLGETFQEALEGKFVLMSANQVDFWQANQTASPQEVWNAELTPEPPPPEPTIEEIIRKKIEQLEEFDKTTEEFFFGDFSLWLTPIERVTLERRIARAKVKGKTTIAIPYGDIELNATIQEVEYMLFLIDEYADATSDLKEAHKAAIKALETASEIDAYDFTANYPPKLQF